MAGVMDTHIDNHINYTQALINVDHTNIFLWLADQHGKRSAMEVVHIAHIFISFSVDIVEKIWISTALRSFVLLNFLVL